MKKNSTTKKPVPANDTPTPASKDDWKLTAAIVELFTTSPADASSPSHAHDPVFGLLLQARDDLRLAHYAYGMDDVVDEVFDGMARGLAKLDLVIQAMARKS